MIEVKCPCGAMFQVSDGERDVDAVCPKCQTGIVAGEPAGRVARKRVFRSDPDFRDIRLHPRVSVIAVVTLICGVLSVTVVTFLAFPAMFLGFWALTNIHATNKKLHGTTCAV